MPAIESLILAPLIVLAGYVVFGISGFGVGLVTVPLLAHLFPLRSVIPTMVLLDCMASFGMGVRLRGEIDRRGLRDLLPFMLAGMALGVAVLVYLPRALLLFALGLFALAYGVQYVRGRGQSLRLPRWSAAPLGLCGGALSAAFSVGGPLYLLYLTGRGASPGEVRATVPVIFVITTVMRIALFAIAGLYTRDMLIAAAALLPVMALGIWYGHRLHTRFTRASVIRVMGAVLIVSGTSLIVRSLSD